MEPKYAIRYNGLQGPSLLSTYLWALDPKVFSLGRDRLQLAQVLLILAHTASRSEALGFVTRMLRRVTGM